MAMRGRTMDMAMRIPINHLGYHITVRIAR